MHVNNIFTCKAFCCMAIHQLTICSKKRLAQTSGFSLNFVSSIISLAISSNLRDHTPFVQEVMLLIRKNHRNYRKFVNVCLSTIERYVSFSYID